MKHHRRFRPRVQAGLALILATGLLGCEGELSTSNQGPGNTTISMNSNNTSSTQGGTGVFTSEPGTSVGTSSGSGTISTANPVLPEGLHIEKACKGDCGTPEPLVTTQFARMTLIQYRNSVRDLFGLDQFPDLKVGFPNDQPKSTFNNPIFDARITFEVGEFLWIAYRDVAQKMSELAVSDAKIKGYLTDLAQGQNLEEQGRAFITEFGRRAYRRPLTQAEVDVMYQRLFVPAAGLYPEQSPLDAGIRMVVRAMLQSPQFLYLVEREQEGAQEVVLLNGHERATRMAYVLWHTTPSPELLDRAARGELDTLDGVASVATQMMEDPKAAGVIKDFHAQLFEFDKYKELKDKDWPQLADDLKREDDLFIEDVLFTQKKGFRDLITSSETWVNERSAKSYGLDPAAYGEQFEKVTLDPSQRAGILTHVGWLRAHAYGAQPEPIKRGLFINEKLLCTPLKPAPATFDLPTQEPGTPVTNRELFHNATNGCGAGCHDVQINPAGFAFENFDGMGQWRTMDNGYPVDASGLFKFKPDQFEMEYNDAVEMLNQASKDYRAHSCYSFHWVEYMMGRSLGVEDEPLIRKLAYASSQDTLNVKAMLVDIVSSPSFMSRRLTTPMDNSPAPKIDIRNVVDAGYEFSCLINAGQALECWGRDDHGQITNAPKGSVTAVALGVGHGCALDTQGVATCWGKNEDGERDVPSDIKFKQLAAGYIHTCGITTEDNVVCWGTGTDDRTKAPAGTFKSIHANYENTCAIDFSDKLTCWGSNSAGQLTIPNGTYQAVSVGFRNICGLLMDGSAKCWGGDNNATIGDVPSTKFKSIAAGRQSACGINQQDRIECWGDNRFQEQDDVDGNFEAKALIYGQKFLCAASMGGKMTCWGDPEFGQTQAPSSSLYTSNN